jgi:hypothetical protein
MKALILKADEAKKKKIRKYNFKELVKWVQMNNQRNCQ